MDGELRDQHTGLAEVVGERGGGRGGALTARAACATGDGGRAERAVRDGWERPRARCRCAG